MKIKINHLEKIEGHAGFVAHIINNQVKKAQIEVLEGARQFEELLVGRHFNEAPIISSRVCGVCPIVHNLSSIKAVEAVFGVKTTPGIELARQLMFASEMINSHTLHLFFLSAGDFLDDTNNLTLIKRFPQEARHALEIRSFAIRLAEIVGGRSIHPINSVVGGFREKINLFELKELMEKYPAVLDGALALANMVKDFKYPVFHRRTDFVCLESKNYPVDGSKIKRLNRAGKVQANSLREFNDSLQEIQERCESVKRVAIAGESYMVGALARVNNNNAKLNLRSRKIFKSLKWDMPQYNSFYNVMAQAIEVVHFVEESRRLADTLLVQAKGAKFIKLFMPHRARAGRGLGVVEAPRGTLFHDYEINKDGIIIKANIITPTAQFLANLEEDLKVYLKTIKGLNNKNRAQHIRRLIRAYDPCISCAVH